MIPQATSFKLYHVEIKLIELLLIIIIFIIIIIIIIIMLSGI